MSRPRVTRWLVTGAAGMLARDLVTVLAEHGSVTAADHAALDVTGAVADEVAGNDIVINTAGWTDVDGAEAAEPAATEVNGHGVALLARACAATGAHLIQLSTDYVFDGTACAPYAEDAPTSPVNAYGRSKLVGEQAVQSILPHAGYIVRTAWLYGGHGRNFVTTMLRLASQRDTVEVVDDQHGQPTWTRALAIQLAALGLAAVGGSAPPGVYHGTAAGQTTWYGLARAVFEAAGLDPARVRPTTSDAYQRPARRPAYSVLSHDRWALAGVPLQPPWQDQLRSMIDSMPVPSPEPSLPEQPVPGKPATMSGTPR